MAKKPELESLPRPLPDIETKEGRIQVIMDGHKGDESVLPLLAKLFDRDRELGASLVEAYGNVHEHAVKEMIKYAAGKDLTIREALRRRVAALGDELAGPDPTPLERIVSERVALTWFDANEMDRRYVESSGISFKDAAYREGRRDRAHKRFLAACKALATVRRLSRPSVQVNLANQQVNVSGSGGLEEC